MIGVPEMSRVFVFGVVGVRENLGVSVFIGVEVYTPGSFLVVNVELLLSPIVCDVVSFVEDKLIRLGVVGISFAKPGTSLLLFPVPATDVVFATHDLRGLAVTEALGTAGVLDTGCRLVECRRDRRIVELGWLGLSVSAFLVAGGNAKLGALRR